MPRYIRRSRTTKQLRDQLLRELEREGQKMLKQLTQDFTASLNGEAEKILQNLFTASNTGSTSNGIASVPFSSDSVGRMLSTGLRYLVNRPKTSRSYQETSRSKAIDQQFRLSRSQAASEASVSLSRGERNS